MFLRGCPFRWDLHATNQNAGLQSTKPITQSNVNEFAGVLELQVALYHHGKLARWVGLQVNNKKQMGIKNKNLLSGLRICLLDFTGKPRGAPVGNALWASLQIPPLCIHYLGLLCF